MIFLILLVIVAFLIWNEDSKDAIITRRCTENPDRNCTAVTSFNRGGMRNSGMTQCCKVRKQMHQINDAICKAGPGQYGEVVITPEYHQKCLASKQLRDKQ